MNYNKTLEAIGQIDIYLIDQILKNRYQADDIILDAGCGEGRNLKWFYINKYRIHGIDADKKRLDYAKLRYPNSKQNFLIGNLDNLPYNTEIFNHIICNAVLHFSNNELHFFKIFSELIRVLKPEGTLFIRTASNIGLDGNVPYLKEGKTKKEGTFYLTRGYIKKLLENYNIELIEPVKTTNVADARAMTTLVVKKV